MAQPRLKGGSERSLLRTVEKELRRRHILYRKRWGSLMGVAGDPDLYLLLHGLHIEIELKREGQNPTPLQQLRLNQWAAAGALTAVVHSPSELANLLDRASPHSTATPA
jgi:hypothetical protein